MTKKEEVVDLKPKAEKITEEQLKALKTLISAINKMHIELGIFEGRKYKMLSHLVKQQDELAVMQNDLEKEYGTVNIDITDGSIKYEEENGEVNKKD